ncbi:hypothetical protein [Natrinema zhouii]|nr:hypothetical protein [Natrinema zhouii]
MRYVPESKLATAGASIVTVWEAPLESSRKFLPSGTDRSTIASG